jgi:hypothetical protein
LAAEPAIVQKLLTDAQTLSDLMAIWRKPSLENARNLLLLSNLVGEGEIASLQSKSYLISLVAHLQRLFKPDEAIIIGSTQNSGTGIVCTMLAYDTFGAVEGKEGLVASKYSYDRLLKGFNSELPTPLAINFALENDPLDADQLVSSVAFFLPPLLLTRQLLPFDSSFGSGVRQSRSLTPNEIDRIYSPQPPSSSRRLHRRWTPPRLAFRAICRGGTDYCPCRRAHGAMDEAGGSVLAQRRGAQACIWWQEV